MQLLITILQFNHIIFWVWEWTYVWLYKQEFGIILEEIFIWVMKVIHEIILFMHWQLMGPMNYNNAHYWVHLICKELFMLWMIVSQTFQYSMQPNFSVLISIWAMIVTKSQIPNCGSKGYCWSFNPLHKVICVKENS